MKRPDVFVCVDSRNLRELCKEFGIRQAGMTYDRYWEDIIERIRDAKWWNCPKPREPEESAIWEARAAFLDALYYREPE